MVDGLEKAVFREGNCQGNRKLRADSAYHFSKLKPTLLNLVNDDSISSKVIRTRTEQFLELFSRTLNILRLRDWNYHCFTRLFWSNAQSHLQGLNKLFLYLMRAFCFCIITISYLVFFHVYCWYAITWFFSCNFVGLWKLLLVLIYSKFHSRSCDYLY